MFPGSTNNSNPWFPGAQGQQYAYPQQDQGYTPDLTNNQGSFNPLSNYTGGALGVPPGMLVGPSHQVKAGETFDSIAKQYGYSVNEIQKTNNALVAPPKGTHIALPGAVPAQNAFEKRDMTPALHSTYTPGAVSGPAMYTGETLRRMNENFTQQIMNNTMPTSIPAQSANTLVNPITNKPLTPADYAFMGYTKDTQGNYVQSGTQAAQTPNGQAAQPQGVYYNKKLGNIPQWEANLRAQRAARRHKRPGEATNAGDVPETVLSMQLGSG